MEDGGDRQNSGYYNGYAHWVALLVSIQSVSGSMAANKITRANSGITGVTRRLRVQRNSRIRYCGRF
ncbi:MAG: hypothetical protein DMG61_14070 [Acidobacteria bacterium]|nr:MAG: hypothetical protein DMG60_22655 [Acidobacteriota bacterium]PYY13210.1 MAG: hypothetical protein DMG61_14070 [Acidobacteriota bacterium]